MTKNMLRVLALVLALLSLCGCGPAPGSGEFTYRQAVTEIPVCYSPLDWSSETESAVLELTASPLYSAGIENGSYVFLPEMAAGEPRDVSASLDRPTGTAWQIDLRADAVWSDGTPITADTYLDSLRELLDPEKVHSRAADYLFLENAWAWYYGDEAGTVSYGTLADCGYLSVAEALREGETVYIDMGAFWGLDCGWQSIDSEELFRDAEVAEGEREDYVSPSYVYNTYLADGAPYAAYQTTFTGVARTSVAKADWEAVGISKTGEYQITVMTSEAMTGEALMQKLLRCFLVPGGYDEGYGMDPESYLSCGPYILTAASAEGLTFARNESWYGYGDEAYQDQYAASAVTWTVMTQADALAAFRRGELDTVTVSQGENAKSIPQTYTSKLTFNTSLSALERRQSEGVNKTILAYREFRQAVSASIDRDAFVAACVPWAEGTLGLINDTFLTDLADGTRYRDTDQGRQVLESLYGQTGGYDPALAARLLQQAYDTALADGRIGEADVVELEFLVYSDTQVYRDIVDFLQQSLDAAAAGTSLEGRLRILWTVDQGYYDTAKTGEFEIILSTWGGVEADPYTILSCYCDPEKRYEYGFDPSRESCTLTLEGVEQTRSYLGWYQEMAEETDAGRKLELLAALEEAVLARYDCVPIYERSVLFLDGERIRRPVDTAVPFAGFGGVRYAQFLADDAGEPVAAED